MHIPHDPKAMAKSLRQALSERHIEITHGDSLECVARQFGWRDWNTLAAQIARPALRMPEDWTIGGSLSDAYVMGLDEAENCALIRFRGDLAEPFSSNRGSGFGTLMQHFQAKDYRDTRLELRAQLKAEGVTGAATLWLRIDGERGRVLAFDNMEGRRSEGPLVGTAGWQERSIVLDVPPDAQAIHFGFYLRGGGCAWARRFRVTQVEASVPVTDEILPRRSAPANLDFAAAT